MSEQHGQTQPAHQVLASLEHVTVRNRLEDATMQLHQQQRLALIGRSGAGKTTTMRLLMGTLTPDQGTCIPATRFSYIPQDVDASLNPHMKISDIIAEPVAIANGRAAARELAGTTGPIAQLLSKLGLDPAIMHRKPGALSGGQRQRVAIARALITQPDVVFADEAISALDEATAQLVMDLLHASQAALVVITHDLYAAARLCDSFVILDQGRIVETGDAKQLLNNNSPCSTARSELLHALQELAG